MKTPCIGCGCPIPVGRRGRCFRCQSPARRYRSSRAWARARAAVRVGAVCARCGAAEGLEVHHETPLAVDLAAGIKGELVPLCGSCHDREHGHRPRSD